MGYGTYVSATPALARTTVMESSNADSAVDFSAGTKDIFITSPAIGQGWGVLTVTPSTNQNDYNPTGLKYCNILRANIGATMKITGLQGGFEGRRIVICNQSTDFLLWLENENTASTAAYRFTLPGGFPAFLMPGDIIELIYNGTDSRWEVLTWPNQGQGLGLMFFNDFIGQATPGNSGALGPFATGFSGTGASSQISTYLANTTERPMGIQQVDSGTTATGRCAIGGGNSADIIPTLGAALSVARLAVETTVTGADTFTVKTGFIDEMAGGTPTDGVCWENRWTGSVAEWSQSRFAATAATRTNTGSPTPDNNYICLGVFINPGWTRADFFYSTDSVSYQVASSPTTGFPSSAQPTAFAAVSMLKSASNNQRNASIDWAGMRVDYVRA